MTAAAGRSGTVVQSRGGVYTVALDDGVTVDASLRKRLKRQRRTGDRVVVGDRVQVAGDATAGWTVEAVEPRRSQVARRAPGGRRAKVVAANVQRLVVVVAAVDPEPTPEQIDRLLVVGEADGVPSVLVVNKVDLPGGRERSGRLVGLYGGVGYPVLRTSALTGDGIDELGSLLCRGISALVGPSGVGKSSLLNAVEPGLGLRVAEVSRRRRSGRHTTVSARLLTLGCGGAVADTPGFSDVGLWGVTPNELDLFFPEMVRPRDACRFRGCTHVHEPECGVKQALEDGRIARSRYESYRTLLGEAEES